MTETVHIGLPGTEFDARQMTRGAWLVLLHCRRVPPHAGLLIGGSYNSLTIKGPELNVSAEALLKTVSSKKIESLFIKLKEHPVFSCDHQLEICQHFMGQYEAVTGASASCLAPLRLFFQEFYAIPLDESELLYTLIGRLHLNGFISSYSSQNLHPGQGIDLPVYSTEQLDKRIRAELPAYQKS